MSKSVLGDLPEGVESAMYLRDGWPHAVVCKVIKGGCVGIGMYRAKPGCRPISPEFADNAAMIDAIAHLATEPPDYSEIQEHVAQMRAKAEEVSRPLETRLVSDEQPDDDLQAALGQKAHG